MDYFIELNDLGRQIDTLEMKRLFHDSLEDAVKDNSDKYREGKSTDFNKTEIKLDGKFTLGNFILDPTYTEFIGKNNQIMYKK